MSLTLDFNPSHCQVGTFITLNNHHNKQTMMTKDEHKEEIELNQIKLESSEELKPPGDLVGPKTEPADTPFIELLPLTKLRYNVMITYKDNHMRIIISGQGEKERFHVCPSPPHWRTSENCLASLAKIYN